jgi:hypothetical protein
MYDMRHIRSHNQYNQLCRYEFRNTIEQYQEMYVRYYEVFGWESREDSK